MMESDKIISEEWRDIAGYEGLYQISNMGRVKSLRGWNVNKAIQTVRREHIMALSELAE